MSGKYQDAEGNVILPAGTFRVTVRGIVDEANEVVATNPMRTIKLTGEGALIGDLRRGGETTFV